MVVSRVLCDGAGQLSDLDLPLVVALEAGVEHFPLARLEPVQDTRDGALVVHVGEEDELLVDKVRV